MQVDLETYPKAQKNLASTVFQLYRFLPKIR